MLEWWNLLALGLAGFITAYVSSVVGFGGGAMMVIAVLFFMPPLVAIPFHAVVQLVANGLRGALLWRSAPWLLIVPFSVALLPGSILGRAAFSDIPEQTIYILIGLAALLAFLPTRWRYVRARGRLGWAVLGFVVGLIGVLVGAVGVLFAPSIYQAGLRKEQVVAGIAIMASLAHVMKIAAFSAFGLSLWERWPEMLITIPAIVLGTIAGKRALHRLDEARFRRLFQAMLLTLALKTIFWDGLLKPWLASASL